jgi:hypothetical protein
MVVAMIVAVTLTAHKPSGVPGYGWHKRDERRRATRSQRRRVSFTLEKLKGAAHVAGEGSGDLPSDAGSSSSPSTPLRSTALTATMMEDTDINSAENSGLSMMP